MKWRYLTPFCLAALGCVIWLHSRGGAGADSALAAQQLDELQQITSRAEELEPEMAEIFHSALSHYMRTHDARYADPYSGIGILHIACIFKKTELVRSLLRAGADPNNHPANDDSPLLLALGTYLTPGIPTQELTTLADTLIAAGASLEESGADGMGFLTRAAFVCENEDVLLHLMDAGARADSATAVPMALHGWERALTRVLKQQPDTRGLLHMAAVGSVRYEGKFFETIQLLLDRGADVNGSETDEPPGATPLFRLAETILGLQEDSPVLRARGLVTFRLLMQHGADPYRRVGADENYPGFSAYDILALSPALLAEAAQQGISLQAPPLSFSTGNALVADVCRVAATPPPAEELEPHFDSIAAVLAPTPEMQRSELYPAALEAAVALLARISPARAAESIASMPLWQRPAEENARLPLAALLAALHDHPELQLPKDLLCKAADTLAAAKRTDDAALLVEQLGRCPDAQEELARYAHDELLPLQAGAYAALLQAAGLPDARDNGVQAWLSAHKLEPSTPFLRDAALLTSLELLWTGKLTAEEQQRLLGLMRSIGAPTAAGAYEQIIRYLDTPEKLDELMQAGDDWKYELEVATARYFLEHKQDFPTTAP